MPGYSDITIEEQASGVQILLLSRPEAHNALRTQTLKELADALDAAQQNDRGQKRGNQRLPGKT